MPLVQMSDLPCALPGSRCIKLFGLLDGGFEITLRLVRKRSLAGLVGIELALSLGYGSVVGDTARVSQDVLSAEFEEVIKLGDPVFHGHGATVACLQLREFEVGRDYPIERLQFLGIQVVLRDGDIGSLGRFSGPASEAHVGFTGVGTERDHFGSGVSVCRPVHFVLNGFEEGLRGFRVSVVVDAGGVDVEDFFQKTFSEERMSRMRVRSSSK